MSQEIKICSDASAYLIGGLSAQDTISTDKLSVACGFKKPGGTSGQFLKADGSTDAQSYTTCIGTVTPSSTDTFTNKSGNISQWTNDSGYTTCNGDITGVTAGSQMTGGATSGTATVNVALSTGGIGSGTYGPVANDQKIDQITVDEFGRVTAVTCGPTGDITGITAGAGLSGSQSSGTACIGIDSGTLTPFDQSACAGLNCTGTTTASNTQTFTNKSGNISQWTNDSGYTTCNGDITQITLTAGLTGASLTSGNACIGLDGATAAALDQSALESCAGLDCVGTTTASNTQTFTNKSGNISQWTNDSGYTTCTGDITGVTAGLLLSGGGASGSVTLGLDSGALAGLDQSACPGIDCVGVVETISGSTGISVTGTAATKAVAVDSTCNTTWNSAYTTTKNLSGCAGLACTGDIEGVTAGAGLSGGGTSGSVTVALDGAMVATLNQSGCAGINCTGVVETIAGSTGIDVTGTAATKSIAVDSTVVRTTGNFTVAGDIDFTGNILSAGTDLDQLFGAGGGGGFDTAGSGLSSSGTTVGLDATTANSLNQASCPGINCTGTFDGFGLANFLPVFNDADTLGCSSLCMNGSTALYSRATTTYVNVLSTQAICPTDTLGSVQIGSNPGTVTGVCNIGIGAGVFCGATTSGSQNVGIGDRTLRDISSGGCNVAIGWLAATSVNQAQNVIAIGQEANFNGTSTADHNIALGQCAMYGNATFSGDNNIAIGRSTLRDITTGNNNIAIGEIAGINMESGSGNIALGLNSMFANTTGNTNVGIGSNALLCNTDGDLNTAVGSNTLRNNITGCYNTAFGSCAQCSTTTGCFNNAQGYNSLCTNTTGQFNNAFGNSALLANNGTGNAAFGGSTLRCNTTGNYNAAVGFEALYCNTTGCENVALGHEAMYGNTTGCNNVAIGDQALFYSLSGNHNFALGQYTLYDNYGGDFNTAIGTAAMQCNTTGSANAALGYRALFNNTTGNDNFAIGECALESNVNGIGNNAQGHYALGGNVTGNYTIGIGNNAGAYFADGSTALSGADDSIYIGRDTRGKDNDDYNSIVIGVSACSCGQNTIKMGNGDITAACVQVAWTAVSDERDKTDITELDKGLTFVGDLKPKAFKYRENRESTVGVGQCRYGFLAQDILATEGSNNVVVSDSNPDQLGINSDYLVPILVKAVQELEARVKQLESPEATQS